MYGQEFSESYTHTYIHTYIFTSTGCHRKGKKASLDRATPVNLDRNAFFSLSDNSSGVISKQLSQPGLISRDTSALHLYKLYIHTYIHTHYINISTHTLHTNIIYIHIHTLLTYVYIHITYTEIHTGVYIHTYMHTYSPLF